MAVGTAGSGSHSYGRLGGTTRSPSFGKMFAVAKLLAESLYWKFREKLEIIGQPTIVEVELSEGEEKQSFVVYFIPNI